MHLTHFVLHPRGRLLQHVLEFTTNLEIFVLEDGQFVRHWV